MKKIDYICIMKRFSILTIALASCLALQSAPPAGGGQAPKPVSGRRTYTVMVNQMNDTVQLNGKLRRLNANRGILMDLAQGYLSMGTSTILSASKNILDYGVALIREATRDKRPDWQKMALEECRFVKRLPMQTQVLDFYSQPSHNGALDPTNMNFSGFGCRQTMDVTDGDGNVRSEEVFYLSCSLRDDDAGVARMLNHSKFEVVVDELRFNPYLCNLPNDSLSPDPSTRIGFSFDKRKDLTFNVEALLSSSWINEAIQVVNDQELGRFFVTAMIDPEQLDCDGVFRYRRGNPADSAKRVSVTGDSFIVPRSYVGSADMATASDSWGTGQYRVDMNIYETCAINEKYYTEMKDGKRVWLKDRWQPEWRLMKKRTPRQGFWQTVSTKVVPSLSGNQWLTTITEPLTTVLMTHEGKLVNEGVSKLGVVGAGAAAGAAQGGTAAQQGGAGGQGKQPGAGSPAGGQNQQKKP